MSEHSDPCWVAKRQVRGVKESTEMAQMQSIEAPEHV